ncbi:hypothetical protein BH09PSE4_BH09PSE4_21370 [soil metagenome]
MRRRFALSGRSVTLDPRTHAIRADIADIRLSDRIFAPHYVAPMPRVIAKAVTLRAGADKASEILADLQVGAPFEVFDLSGGNAWGIATAAQLVGYIDASALGRPS